jgi:hypothetical protein
VVQLCSFGEKPLKKQKSLKRAFICAFSRIQVFRHLLSSTNVGLGSPDYSSSQWVCRRSWKRRLLSFQNQGGGPEPLHTSIPDKGQSDTGLQLRFPIVPLQHQRTWDFNHWWPCTAQSVYWLTRNKHRSSHPICRRRTICYLEHGRQMRARCAHVCPLHEQAEILTHTHAREVSSKRMWCLAE